MTATQNLGFGATLTAHAASAPNTVALAVDGVGQLSYADWERRSWTVARVLALRGLQKGERIALTYTGLDWIDYAIAYLGVLRAGCVAVHLGAHLPAEEYLRRSTECDVVGVMHSADHQPAPGPGWAATVRELEEYDDGRPGAQDILPEDEAEIIYSSATTGNAGKGVIATHANLMYWCSPESIAEPGQQEPRLTVAPLSTGGSAVVINNLLTSPSPYTLIIAGPDHERIAELVAEHRVGTLLVVAWVSIQMVRHKVHLRHDLSSVHTIGSGAMPTPPVIAERLLAMMPGAKLLLSYSGSQLRPAAALGTFDPQRPFAIGHGTGNSEFKIVGMNGRTVPDGQVGEIYMRSDVPARRYVGEHPADPVEVDGWTGSGDLGFVGTEGELCFFDRKADAFVLDGTLMSSVILEATLYGVDGVWEAGVVKMADRTGTDQVVAAIAAESDAVVERAREALGRALPNLRRPPYVIRLESLPRDPLGKLRKRELRDQLTKIGWDAQRPPAPATPLPPTLPPTVPPTLSLPLPPSLPAVPLLPSVPSVPSVSSLPSVPSLREVEQTMQMRADMIIASERGRHHAGPARPAVAPGRPPHQQVHPASAPPPPLSGAERAELAALRAENTQLRTDLAALRRALVVISREMC